LSGARLIELKLSSEITGWQAVVVEETTWSRNLRYYIMLKRSVKGCDSFKRGSFASFG
jgi:hypothetical protein